MLGRRHISPSWVGLLLTVFASLFAARASAEDIADQIAEKMRSLAPEFVVRSIEAKYDSIAVLPFQGPEGACSQLSVLVADELTDALSHARKAPLRIIERAKLTTVVQEIVKTNGGLFDRGSVHQLGSLSGASALLVGDLSPVGTSIRVYARLLATETGEVIASDSVTLPHGDEIIALEQTPLHSDPGCSFGQAAEALPPTPTDTTLPDAITADAQRAEKKRQREIDERAALRHFHLKEHQEAFPSSAAATLANVSVDSVGACALECLKRRCENFAYFLPFARDNRCQIFDAGVTVYQNSQYVSGSRN